AEHLKVRAEAAEAEGDFGKSADLLSQYLSFRKDDLDTLLRLVRLRDGLATTGRALQNAMLGYEEVLRRDPNRADEAEIRQDVIAVAMAIREHSVALYHLQALLEDEESQKFREENPAQTAELYYLQGQCYHAKEQTK